MTVLARVAAFLCFLCAFLPAPLSGQEREAAEHEEETHHSIAGRHRITLGLGHTHLSQGRIEGDTEWLATASWALNYDYWLTDRWALGLQNELIVEQFLIEHGEDEFLEREHPLAVIPAVLFKATEWLTLIGGVGVEFASEENLWLTRLGIEPGWHVAENWEVGAALVWDNKWDYYNSWGIAFTVSRFLGHGR